MNKVYNVLIIDDHQIIIDTFKNALLFIQNEYELLEFKVDEAKCCQTAFEKIMTNPKHKNIDLFFLDISLPPSEKHNIFSGEDLGIEINKYFSNSKIIVCTGFNDNLRLHNIIKTINPDSLLIKSDINFNDIVKSINTVLRNETFYSKTIISLLRKNTSNSIILGNYDIQILYEMANGARMKELIQLIPLTKSGIEKRKRILKEILEVKSDRELVLVARDKGFI